MDDEVPNLQDDAGKAAADAAAKASADTAAKAAADAAAKAAAASAPNQNELQDPSKVVIQVAKTGDAGLDLAHSFFAKNGVAPGSDAWKAMETGDMSKIKEALKGKPDADAYLSIAEGVTARAAKDKAAQGAAIQGIVESVAGGKDKWVEARDWAAAEATPEQRDQINTMLRQGGLQAKLAAQYIVGQHAKHTAKGAPVVTPNAAGAAGADGAALSPAEFQREVARLTEKHGGRFMLDLPEYKALENRRAQYRGR